MNPACNDVDLLARNWSAILLRALCAMVFGLFSVFSPARSLAALALAFGGYALVSGVFAVCAAVQRRRDDEAPRWAYLWTGLLGIGSGLLTLLWPGMTMLVLVYVVAAWASVGGSLQVVAALRLRQEIRGEWLLALSGMASVVFGIWLVVIPVAPAVALVFWLGLYVLLEGAVLAALTMRLRSWESERSREHLPLPLPASSAVQSDTPYLASGDSRDRDSAAGAQGWP